MISILTYREPPSRGSLLNLSLLILDQTLEMVRCVLRLVLPVITAAMNTPARIRLKVNPPRNQLPPSPDKPRGNSTTKPSLS